MTDKHLILLKKYQLLLQKFEETKELLHLQRANVQSGSVSSVEEKNANHNHSLCEQILQKTKALDAYFNANDNNPLNVDKSPQNHKQQLLEDYIGTSYGVLPWNSPLWDKYQPSIEIPLLPTIRLGTLEIENSQQTNIPLCLDIIGQKNLLLKAKKSTAHLAIKCLQNAMLRLLALLPPARVRFLMLDPVGIGINFAGFMNLPEEAIHGKIWSDAQKIEEKLGEFCEQMENIIQKHLLNRYRSIEEYNEDAAEVAEPYRIIVVANFPNNFTVRSAQRLLTLAKHGPKSGIYLLLHVDPSKKTPYDFSMQELEDECHVLEAKQSHFFYQRTQFNVVLEEAPKKKFNDLIQKISHVYSDANRVTVPYEKFINKLYPVWWQEDTRESVKIPIGKAGQKEHYFCVGKGLTHHALMVGKTGSGKSTLLNILILGSATLYSPQEMQLYLIDFKEGVEFKKYATPTLPHAKVIAIQSEREFGLSVLRGLDEELSYRGEQLFRPNNVKNITQYRNKQQQDLPRILLIVDEFQEFFTEEDQLAVEARNILERLVRKGRSAGIHIVLSSQSLTGSGSLPLAITNQIAIRIALQCSDGDSRLVLGEENPAAKHLQRPGEGIYNDANGLVDGNTVFQTFWLEDRIMEEYLHKIHREAPQRCETIIFDGDSPGSIEKNHLLLSKDHKKIWFGQPVSMKEEHTHIILQQQTGANLLFIGQNEERIMGVFLCAVISAIINSPNAKFYLINLGSSEMPWQNSLEAIIESICFEKNETSRRSSLEVINEIQEVVASRVQEESIQKNEDEIFLFFIGMHRARDLYAPDSWSPPQETKKFISILEDGPDVGVHSFIHCDTRTNMNKILSQSLKDFDIRIVLQMNAMDSSSILDSIFASRLDANRALLYNEEHSSHLEKFRPYEYPSEEWIRQLFHKIAGS